MDDDKIRITKDDLDGGGGDPKGGPDETTATPAEDTDATLKQNVPKKAKKDPRPKTKASSPTGKTKGKKGPPKKKPPGPKKPPAAGPTSQASTTAPPGQSQRGLIRRQHPMVLVGSGIALFAVIFAGTFLLIDVLKTDKQRSQDVLDYSTKAVTEVQEGIERARGEELPYSFLKDLAGASRDLSKKVESKRVGYQAEVTDKPQLTGPTITVVNADLKYLRSFAKLAKIEDAEIGQRWRQIKRDMRNAIGTIDDERAMIQSEISDDPSLLPADDSLNRSLREANGIVTAADQKLQAWFTKVDRLNSQCELVKNFSAISASLVSEYRSQRSDTNSALEGSRLDWDEAQAILNDQTERRASLATRFQSEQAPPRAQGSWTRMGLLVEQSVDVLSEGARNIGGEPLPSGEFWQGSLSKDEFDGESGRISQDINSTDSLLKSDLAAAENATCNRKKPTRPKV